MTLHLMHNNELIKLDDVRWNVYHILCSKNHCDLLEHLLRKLPRDVNEALLTQQSKGTLDTVSIE